MKIAVINEVSARDKNAYIVEALRQNGHEVINVGMTEGEYDAELNYIHTGLMTAVLLNLGACDFVVGGCGTGMGFMLSAMQYPNVFCGLVSDPLDAFLFGRINGGNCLSLPLNKGFGWAGDVNLKYVFEKLFSADFGKGYPAARMESQQKSRRTLTDISEKTHKPFTEILSAIDKEIISVLQQSKRFVAAVKGECVDKELQKYILKEFFDE